MRKRISTPELLFMMLAPLLGACPKRGSYTELAPIPDCQALGTLLTTTRDGDLICKEVSSLLILQDCHQYSEALTSDGKMISCTNRNNETLAAREALENLTSTEKLIDDYTTRLGQLSSPLPIPFCGQTANMPNAAFQAGAARGIAAATTLCTMLPTCGNSAHMCSVYEMYKSVVNGSPASVSLVGKSWVYMAAWSQEFSDNSGLQKEPGAGLADNCGGFTVGDSSKKWYGTAVSFAPTASGDKALKFTGGPPNVGAPGTTSILVNANAVACNAALPIACCR